MISTLLTVAALAAAAPCTQHTPSGEALDSLPVPIPEGALSRLGEELLLDEPGDGRTWARAATWKASFGADGMTYVPFFGSDAPQNFPITFGLDSVSLSGETLAMDAVERSRADAEVTLDRGSLREVYHLSKETVEQTFVFDQLPARGELVLEVAVATDLLMRPLGGGFEFSNELGTVTYGAATAIDAAGHSVALESRIAKGGFQIVVPADFVAAAELPLVVDPILSTFSVTNDSRRQVAIDVAYEGTNTTYQIALAEVQSGTDHDIVVVNYNAALDLLLPAASIDISSEFWSRPSNASALEPQMFLCVAQVGIIVGSTRVFGRTVHSGSGVRGPRFEISSASGAANPDVGGKGNGIVSAYDFLVVWDQAFPFGQDFNVVAQAVSSDSTLTFSQRQIAAGSSDHDRFPTISKTSGRPGTSNADNEYLIAWEREITSTDHNIRGQVVEYTGNASNHNQFNVYTFSDSVDPDVSSSTRHVTYGDEKYWLVAFERRTGTDYDIFAVIARDGFADNARNVGTMQDLDQQLDHRDPIVGFDGLDFIVGYQTTDLSGDRTVHWTGLNVVHDDGELRTSVAERRGTLDVSLGQPANLGLATHWDGGGPEMAGEPGDALITWVNRTGGASDTDAGGAIVAEVSFHSAGSQYCDANVNSTGTSAWMRARGSGWNPGEGYSLRCVDMPQNSFAFFVVSNQSGFTMNPGGSSGNLCLQGAIGRFVAPGQIKNTGSSGQAFLSIDSGSLPSPIGPIAVSSGETWYFQTWFRDVGPTSNFSNGVELTFD